MHIYNFNIRNILIASFITILLLVLIHLAALSIYGHKNIIHSADLIVVFGNRVEPNGEPSDRLKARLNAALDLYNQDYSQKILVSGGLGKEGYEEADGMAEYLISKGVTSENIYKDYEGYDTEMSTKNTKQFLKENNLNSVIVVSSFYHIPRIKMYFKKNGMNEVYQSHSNYYESRDAYSLLREIPAFYDYLLLR